MTMRNYFGLTKKMEWKGPILAESAEQALDLFLVMDSIDNEVPCRIIKVERSGELIEFTRRGTRWHRQ